MDFLLQAGRPELTNWIGLIVNWLFGHVGSIGWAVVLFAVLVKVATMPLDIWQKSAMRKQSRAMARVKPQLEKLQKQYEGQPQLLRMEQYKLQKKEGVSFVSSCLPMIAHMAIFFFIMAGFRAFISYQNQMIVHNLAERYFYYLNTPGLEWSSEVAVRYYDLHGFLWIQNVFMPDNWSSIIPSLATYTGGGIGGFAAPLPPLAEGIPMSYQTLVGPAAAHYTGWNGMLFLPILTIATSIASTKLMQSQNPMAMAGDDKQKTQQRVMMFMMPLIMAVFAIFWSAAFAIYILTSNIITSLVGLAFNFTAARKDANVSRETAEE